ncbi:hypothetical protein MYP_4683 [Sporocytophaga myxococcoides]|uniref:Uncharacterized protein n=1 Tax=Sporocytophaga myxococcoides TaxID=153721 RepID=A0A098LMW1_9BACT|nr:hypothetical protein [Sporocytophaga myxococcoides]GAL87453.1 hypothetical protein MYP_4683 [Sporocytophaga myxococcoides]
MSIYSSSPDGSLSIFISGIKPNLVDPFTVRFGLKGMEFSEAPSAEIYATDLNEKTVNFEWETNQRCLIRFKQQDGKLKSFVMDVDSETLSVNELHINNLSEDLE